MEKNNEMNYTDRFIFNKENLSSILQLYNDILIVTHKENPIDIKMNNNIRLEYYDKYKYVIGPGKGIGFSDRADAIIVDNLFDLKNKRHVESHIKCMANATLNRIFYIH